MDYDTQLFANLAKSLATENSPPREVQVCPKCQGTLHVSVEFRHWLTLGPRWSMYMRCEDCGAEICFDGLVPSPPWDIPDKS